MLTVQDLLIVFVNKVKRYIDVPFFEDSGRQRL